MHALQGLQHYTVHYRLELISENQSNQCHQCAICFSIRCNMDLLDYRIEDLKDFDRTENKIH